MNCLQFRKQFGTDPASQEQQLLAHRQACTACADFAARVQDFDRRLLLALRIPLADDHGDSCQVPVPVAKSPENDSNNGSPSLDAALRGLAWCA